MKKSAFFVIAVLMIAAFVLAACPAATPAPATGGDTAATEATTGDTASTGGDTASTGGDTAASCECTDPVGCVTVGADDPVRVGWMMVVSGADATLGLDFKYGVEIAADDRGTIADHAIELVGEDDLCSAGRRPDRCPEDVGRFQADRRYRHELLQRSPRGHPCDVQRRRPHDLSLQHGA